VAEVGRGAVKMGWIYAEAIAAAAAARGFVAVMMVEAVVRG